MVIKVYISGISASKDVKKRQQRALFILDSLKVGYEAIDITEPGNQEHNDRFREVCKKPDGEKIPLPPQFFNGDTYCGDWDDFFVASDEDTVLQFLQLAPAAGEDILTPVLPDDGRSPSALSATRSLTTAEEDEEIEDQVFDGTGDDSARSPVNGLHVNEDHVVPSSTGTEVTEEEDMTGTEEEERSAVIDASPLPHDDAGQLDEAEERLVVPQGKTEDTSDGNEEDEDRERTGSLAEE